jgi:abortive infection bacteriophage resistance protein
VEYLKGHLPLAEQAQRLLDRGLNADKEELIRRLSAVSYYRLSGYLFPFREQGSDSFRQGTELKIVWDRYCFDRRLRVLLLDAIERVEVAVRTQLIYHLSYAHGAFGHTHEANFPGLKISEYIEWRESLIVETNRSKEAFKDHFFKKYGVSHQNLPIWMVSELMSMGSMLTFYKGVEKGIQDQVAGHFGMPDELLLTWLRSLYAARNICAHHSRIWNRLLGYAPGLPQKNKHPDWHLEDENGRKLISNNRTGMVLIICHQFLKLISPTSRWQQRVNELFAEYPEIPSADMGLSADWQNHPLWKS